MSIMDLLSGLGGAGQDPNSRLALAASNDARSQAAQPQTPNWGFGDPTSGAPLFGDQSAVDDKTIDPDTGLTKGFLAREDRKQGLQQALMLIAAGSARDDGARAQILSGMATGMDSSSRIQNFAKMRLDMARARLADQQAKQAAAQDASFNAMIEKAAGGAPAAPAGGAPAPQAPSAPPAGPMAATVGAGAAPAAAAVAAGRGNAADAAIATAAASGAPQGAPPQPQAQPAPAPRPAVSMLGAGGATPILPDSAPDKITPPQFAMTPEQANMLKSAPDIQARRALFEKMQSEHLAGETVGAPVMLKGTTKVVAPVYDNAEGRIKGYHPIGDGSVSTGIEVDPVTGDKTIVGRDARGNKTSISAYEGQSDKDKQRLDADDLNTAKTNAAALQKNYTALADVPQRAARVDQAIQDIADGKVNTGPASGFLNYGKRLMDTFGGLSDDEKKKLLATDNAAGLEGTIVAKLAKANNGSQVTDADVKFAQSIVTGGGSPDEIAAALTRYKQDLRNDVALHNQAAERHNALIGNVKAGGYSAGQLKVDTVKMPTDENVPAYATPDTTIGKGQNAPAAPSTALGLLRGAMGGGAQPAPIQGAPAAGGSPPAPATGTVSKGYRFKGGDPSKPESWEKV